MLEKQNKKELVVTFVKQNISWMNVRKSEKTVEERSELIGKKKLCYGCLELMTKEHNAKN